MQNGGFVGLELDKEVSEFINEPVFYNVDFRFVLGGVVKFWSQSICLYQILLTKKLIFEYKFAL